MACFIISQAQINRIKGTLNDTIGQPISGAMLVIMNSKDSSSIAMEYAKEATFDIKYHQTGQEKLMLYISVYGFQGKFLPLKSKDEDLGKIVLLPLAIKMDEVTITRKIPLQHTFSKGKDEFRIPEWMGEQEYDLNSLLSNIPGIAVDGNSVKIIGSGSPVYTINGLTPRPGELESLSPQDIEKIIIDRMPSAKYDKTVKGIINIVIRKKLKDYLSTRLSNNFIYRQKAGDNTAIAINNQAGKWVNYLNYIYSYAPNIYESVYKSTLHTDAGDYPRIYEQSPDQLKKTQGVNYSPKYNINEHSFIDLQYSYQTNKEQSEDVNTFEIINKEYDDLKSKTKTTNNNHDLILRYHHQKKENNAFTANISYAHYDKNNHANTVENITYTDPDEESININTNYTSQFTNKVLTISANYDFDIGKQIRMEAGGDFAKIWNNSSTVYAGGQNYLTGTQETQATLYLNFGQSLGKIHYQVGLRGEYLYKHHPTDKKINDHPYAFLPSVSFSYKVTDQTNMTLYYRRTTTHPTLIQRDPILHYSDKYEYVQGNPDLKAYIDNNINFRLQLPKNLSLNINYLFAKDPIIQATNIYDESQQITLTTYNNFPRQKNLQASVGWYEKFGFYRLMLNGGYEQTWSKSPFLDSYVEYSKPAFNIRIQQMFSIHNNVRLSVIFNYMTSSKDLNSKMNEYYDLSSTLIFTLFKRRLNILIAGDDLLYTNVKWVIRYDRITEENINYTYGRALRIGITYNFNDFRDMFKKNNSNSYILDRAR